MNALLLLFVACYDPTCPEGYAFDLDGLCTECADGYRKNASAGTCEAEAPADTGTTDTGGTDTGTDDTGTEDSGTDTGADTADSGTADTADSGTADTADTSICGTSDATLTVDVVASVWSVATQCWQTETLALAAPYWWPWAPECGESFNDVAFYLTDGDRCLVFSATPVATSPQNDPAFEGTEAQRATCAGVYAAMDSYPACGESR